MANVSTPTEERALKLLGQGVGVDIVAAAIGVSPSQISQYLSDPIFAAKVAELRFASMAKHTETDDIYDDMESKLQKKLSDLIPFMLKPMEVLAAIKVINAAKRRGISSPEQITGQQTVVQLVMPASVINQFTQQNIQLNVHNQVIRAGEQDLVTVQSASMTTLLETARKQERESPERKNHVYSESFPPQLT